MEGTLPRPRIRAHASLSPTQGPGQRAQVSLTCDSQEELTDVGVDLCRAGHLLAVSRDCAGMWAHLTQKSAAHMATLAHAAAPAHSHPWPPRPTRLPLPTATHGHPGPHGCPGPRGKEQMPQMPCCCHSLKLLIHPWNQSNRK